MLAATIVATAQSAGAAYTLVGAGACRGNGGGTDKVNSRSKTGFATEALCEAECDALIMCQGFAWESSGDNICVLYGPGMAGSCAAPNNLIQEKGDCEAIGNCDNPTTATAANMCGTCSEGGAVRDDSCTTMQGTWTAGTWTTTGVFEEVEGGWTGESMHTDHVHAVSPNAAYVCYDRDIGDHVGRCTNTATTPSGTNCVTLYQGAATFEEDSCPTAAPSNCLWTKAPKASAPKPPHPTAAVVAGYAPNSGACRSTSADNKADASAPQGQDRPPYAYKKNADFPNFPGDTGPAKLAELCNSIPGCLGFHSGPWMSLFGPGLEVCGEDGATCPAGDGWVGSVGQAGTTTLETTKPNHQYICYIKEGGLSTGALVGIIVGGVVGGLVLLGVVYKMCNKGKKPAAKTSA
jgi:hypothetical protein